MAKALKSVLLTRPAGTNEEMAGDLERQGIEVFLSPLLKIERLPCQIGSAETYRGIIVTSANAVRVLQMEPAVCEGLKHLPVYAVGAQTQYALFQAGFREIHTGAGDGHALVDYIVQNEALSEKPFLYLRAQHAAVPVETLLSQKGILTHPVRIYTTRKMEALDAAAENALRTGALDAVLLYSKRTAETFIELLNEKGLLERLRPVDILCISKSVQAYIKRFERVIGDGHIHCAPRPDKSGVQLLLNELYGLEVNNEQSKEDDI